MLQMTTNNRANNNSDIFVTRHPAERLIWKVSMVTKHLANPNHTTMPTVNHHWQQRHV